MAQPTNARPIIKYAINNYSSISKAICDTCPTIIGKPLQRLRPIPFPPVAAVNGFLGVNVNEIPGIAAPNFLGGGSPEIKGLVKNIAGMTDAYAKRLRTSDILYFRTGAHGVAVSKSGKIYTSSATILPKVRFDPVNLVNGFFSFRSSPERLPSFNSRSEGVFDQSPDDIIVDGEEYRNHDKEIAHFALDPNNEKIIYAALYSTEEKTKILARKNPNNGNWEELDWDIPNGLAEGVWGALAVDQNGNLYVADSTHHVIVKVTFTNDGKAKSWQIIGGKFNTPGLVNDEDALDARFNKPSGICVDNDGNIYVGDFGNNVVRKIDDDGVTIYAGNKDGKSGFKDDHLWSDAKFNGPTALAYNEKTETLYVVDYNNKTIREIDDDRDVSTLAGIAGSANPFTDPGGFAMNFYYYIALLNSDPDEAKFEDPNGIAIDPSGLGVYVSSRNYIKYVNTFEAAFTVTAAVGDEKANVGPLPVLPYGVAINPNNGAFFGVPLVEWKPTTYAVAATNHLGLGLLNGFITFEVVNCPTIVDTVLVSKTISYKQLPFTWNGKIFTAAGDAYLNLTNKTGCDSVVVLRLKIQPEFNYNSEPYILSKGQQITPIAPTTAGSAIDVFSVSPALPAGLTLNTQTGVISGTPTTATSQSSPVKGPQTAVQYPAPWTLKSIWGADITQIQISDGNQKPIFENNSTFQSLQGSAGLGTGTPGAYTDFSGLGAIKMSSNTTYSMRLANTLAGQYVYSLDQNFGYLNVMNSYAVYIDYNRDGDFDDAGERVYISASPQKNAHAEVFNLNIPGTAAAGVTKMRIYCVEASTKPSIYYFNYGLGQFTTVPRTTDQALSFYPFFNNISTNGQSDFSIYSLDYGEFEDYNIEIQNPTTQSYVITGSNNVGTAQSTIRIAVNNPSASTTNTTICSTELPYTWNGLVFSQAGTQTAHLVNIYGADSAATLILKVKQATSSVIAVANCGPYTYQGKVYTTSGDYAVHITNAAGCDSSIIFRFRQKATASVTNIDIIPNQLPYTWNSITFTTAGTKSATLKNAEGCDSTATLVLRVLYNIYYPAISLLPINKPITPLSPVVEGNYPGYNSSYGYNISPALPNGLQLNVLTGVISGTPTQLSPLQTYTITLNQDGAKPTTLQLSVGVPTASTNTISNCGPYTWNGVVYSTSTTVSATFKNQYGFDSTATLILTIRNPSESITNFLVNQTELPFTWNGINILKEGSKTIYLVNAAGCDSAVTANVVVIPKIFYNSPQILRPNQPIAAITPQSLGGAIESSIGNVSTFIKNNYMSPLSVAIDGQNNSYVSDSVNGNIYKITRLGVVSTVGGLGSVQALLAVDRAGSLYIADRLSNRILKKDSIGNITVLANASSPNGIAVDAAGNIYFSEGGYHRIRKISVTGVVSTLAGGTMAGFANGNGTAAKFNRPSGLSVDKDGNVYVADLANNRIRKITSAGDVTSFAGNGVATSVDGTTSAAGFNAPIAVVTDTWGNVYVAENGSSKIRKINAAGIVSTLAGTTIGYQDGTGTQAKFNVPIAIASDQHGNVYVADRANAAIRQINTTVYAISPALAKGLQFDELTGIITGTPTDTLLRPITHSVYAFNRAGADSFNLVIAVCNPVATSFVKDTCNEYRWNDSTYTSSTTHTRTLKNRGGCDSVVTMRLTIRRGSTGLTTTATACGSYVWKGVTYDKTGLYTKVYPNAVGCDSTIYLNLTIKPMFTNNLFVDISPLQLPYTWRGKTFTVPGKDSIVLVNGNSVGCDSIITMTVRISPLIPNISYVTKDTVLYWEKKIDVPIAMTNTGAPIPQMKIAERDTLINFSNSGPGDYLRNTVKGLDGAYYTNDFYGKQIFKLSKSGVWTVFATPSNSTVTAMAIDKLGNMYVGINSIPSQVIKITPNGAVGTLTGSPFFYGIGAMAVDANNNLVLVNQETGNQLKITKFNLSTNQYTQTNVDYSPYFDLGELGMKMDSKGNIYVYTNLGTSIMKIKPNGQVSGIGQKGSSYSVFKAGNGTDAQIPQISSMAIDSTNDNVYLMGNGNIVRVDTSANVNVLTGAWFDSYKDQVFRVDSGKLSIINNSTRILFTANIYGVGSIPFMDNYGGNAFPYNGPKTDFKNFDKRIRLDSTGAIVGTPRGNFTSQGNFYADNNTTTYSIVAANQYGTGNYKMAITTKSITYVDQTFVTTSFPYTWKGRLFYAATDTAVYYATNKTSANDTLYTLHLIYEFPEPTITATNNCSVGITLTASAAKNAIGFDGTNVATIKNVQNGSGTPYFNSNSYTKPGGDFGLNPSSAYEIWIKPTSVTGTQYIFTKDTVQAHAAFIGLSIQNGKLVYEFTKGGSTLVPYKLISNNSIPANVWTHIAASYYDSALHVFINGQLEGTLQTPNSFFTAIYFDAISNVNTFPDFYLGGLGRQYGFKGEMDELRVWNTVRNATTIQATKNTLVSLVSAGLGLYYRFDGDVNNNGLYDISISHRVTKLIKPATSISPSKAPINFSSYQWQPGFATSNFIVVNPTTNTTYTLKVEDYKGDIASTSLSVTPLVSNTVETIRVCGSSYIWHGTTYTTSTNTATWKGQNQLGCDSIITLHLTLLPLPTPVISGANNICIGSSATLSAASYSSYTWLPGGQSTAGITVQPNITTTYGLKVADANGCSATVYKTISVGGPSSYTLNINACGSFTWHGTTYTSSTNSPTWHEVNAAGCDSLVTLNLRIDALPVTAIVPANGATICSGNQLQITARASGKQLNLDGNSRVVADAMGVDPTTGFTLEGWVKFTSIGTEQSIISQTSGNTPLPFDAWLNANGRVSFAVGNGVSSGTITSSSILSTNTWYHLAFVYFNNRSYIYINGLSNALGITAVPIAGKLNNFMIGNNESLSRPMFGAIDEIRVWNVPLSQALISGNMNASSKPDANGLVAYYKFDEGDNDLPVNTANVAATATIVGNATHSLSTAPLLYQSYNWTDGSTKPVYYAVDANTLYTATVTDVNGCSAIVSGKAAVSAPTTFTDVVKACGPYTWHGVTYTSSNNTAKWTTQNAAGCDSVVTLNLSIGTPSASTETAVACNYFVWHGTTYTTSTTGATWHTVNASGCDSVVTLNLTIKKAVERTDTVTTCGSYKWHDSTYTSPTTAPTWYGTSKNGCDSIVHLNLTMADVPIAKINAISRVTTNVCQVGIVLQNANEAFTKYATGVNVFSSEMAKNENQQIIGKPDTYPNYGDFNTAWSTKDDQARREFIELTYDNPRPINFIEIYETLNSGTIDTVYVKNPSTDAFEVVYSGKAELYNEPLQNRISFPLTSFAVSTIRIAINSVDLPAQKSIDAVAIGISNNNSYRWSNGSSVDTLLATQPGNYVLTATNGSGCSISDTISLSALELQQSTDDLLIASANRTVTKNVVTGAATIFGKDCELIASLTPTGASAVTGSVNANVWIETTQPTTYVKRHYQIIPAINASTATATVTLYFTQQEFTDFNAVNSTKLPIDATDAANNRAHLLIEKHSGVSSDGSGLPTTYPVNSASSITPTSVIWNAANGRWEVTFSAAGFSGFFVKTQSAVLPVTLVSFTANLAGNRTVALQWNVVEQAGIKNYVVERSVDGNSFSVIGSVAANGLSATGYGHADADLPAVATVYYRLRIVGVDGTVTYSSIVPVRLGGSNLITIYPNPARDFVWLQGGGTNLIGTDAYVTDLQGRVISKTRVGAWPLLINTASLADGVYLIRLDDNQALKLVVGR